MNKKCWQALIEFYDKHYNHPIVKSSRQKQQGMINQGLVDFYKLEYERAILDHFMKTGEI